MVLLAIIGFVEFELSKSCIDKKIIIIMIIKIKGRGIQTLGSLASEPHLNYAYVELAGHECTSCE